MDPITALIILGWVVYQTLVVVYIVYLTIMEIIGWFNSMRELLSNKKYSAVSVKTMLKNGKKAIVQGVLNVDANELEKSRVITYDKLDDQLAWLHDQYDVVTYS